jgi:hypothetical protein
VVDETEISEILSGPGYCKGCKKIVDRLGMVQFRGGDNDPEHAHIPGRIGFCFECAVALFGRKVH